MCGHDKQRGAGCVAIISRGGQGCGHDKQRGAGCVAMISRGGQGVWP